MSWLLVTGLGWLVVAVAGSMLIGGSIRMAEASDRSLRRAAPHARRDAEPGSSVVLLSCSTAGAVAPRGRTEALEDPQPV